MMQFLEARPDVPTETRIVRYLDTLVSNGRFQPGDKLPSEIGLAKELGVPRSTVSFAYARLELFGLVKSRPQSGTYLAKMSGYAFEAFLKEAVKSVGGLNHEEDFGYIFQLRFSHEVFVVRQAALDRTSEDIENLRNISLDVRHRILDNGESIDADLLFHFAVADIVSRPVLRTISLVLASAMINNFSQVTKSVSDTQMQQRWTASMEEHDAIIDAIEASDPDQAEAAMTDHFRNNADFLDLEM